MSDQQVAQKYLSRSVVDGPELYLRIPDAVEFIHYCQSKDLAVLGIEGFLFDCGTLTPRMDLIADYSTTRESSSWKEYRDSVNNEALSFVRNMESLGDMVVSVEVWSEHEWSAANPTASR